ncbi:helix-turn-helix domain-containing protein [Amycolatopsis sp.]|uniref:TetR/AcrR family transcriptional regulator n=1 Tax=Amycolatopsis sp. TaxID=37632 RepID=UPI002CB0436F|nr:helix-turn-helix domain-containing protein [Amycolatopsis sp.]HVV12881.1 helix-turn-helix domain-containing protein [Amycolatopsis sp.]
MANSAALPGRPRSRDAAGLPAVTPDRIIAAALELTAQHGLSNWTLRQLAAAVEAYPAVIYHHVGDRDAVVNAVVDRVIGMYPLPPAELPWRDWFRMLFTEQRVVLSKYPGVARRLSVNGPTVHAAATTVDRGVRALQAAGFGDEAPAIYRFLANLVCLFVSVEDDQRCRSDMLARNSVTWGEHRDDPELPGLAAMSESVHALGTDPDRWENYFNEQFDYAMERGLDGVAARLAAIKGT